MNDSTNPRFRARKWSFLIGWVIRLLLGKDRSLDLARVRTMIRTSYSGKMGMTKEEAEIMRENGAKVHGCYFCLLRSEPAPYWFQKDLVIKAGEHVTRCPKHRKEP